jgi:hypothetical protein
LESNGVECLEAFLVQQLSDEPFNRKRKRLRQLGEGEWEIAYRTWRARFTSDEAGCTIQIEEIASGYTPEELASDQDPYEDKGVHRAFATRAAG